MTSGRVNLRMDINAAIKHIHAHSTPVTESGCWIWLGATDRDGYGYSRTEGCTRKTHRLSYEVFKGPITLGLLVCHSCDIPSCVNPDHLWLGTQQENIQDAHKKGRARNGQKEKTHCKRGHLLSPDNLYPRKNGWRDCLTCKRANDRRRYA